MNNKGQVLVTFILIIPLLLIVAAFIVDNVYISYQMNKLNQLNYLILDDSKNEDLTTSEIEEYIYKNDKDIQIDLIVKTSDTIEITIRKNIKSIFGSIIGKDSYSLVSKKSINISNEDIDS